MKKQYVLVALAIIGILSWSQIVNANEDIIDLGTMEYSDIHEQTLVVEINSSEFATYKFRYKQISIIH